MLSCECDFKATGCYIFVEGLWKECHLPGIEVCCRRPSDEAADKLLEVAKGACGFKIMEARRRFESHPLAPLLWLERIVLLRFMPHCLMPTVIVALLGWLG